jgi:hypothetical protein
MPKLLVNPQMFELSRFLFPAIHLISIKTPNKKQDLYSCKYSYCYWFTASVTYIPQAKEVACSFLKSKLLLNLHAKKPGKIIVLARH